MPSAVPLPGNWRPAAFDAQAEAMALAEQSRRVVSMASAMFASGRRVDMTGLDRSVGLLCAKALDLPPDAAGLLRAELIHLVADLDALRHSMRGDPA